MRKILVIGAYGFIGLKVVDYLERSGEFTVLRYSRTPRDGCFFCKIGDDIWMQVISDCAAIINCSGIGLSKIKQDVTANATIARNIVEALPDVYGKKYRILHLSSVKAFNENNYIDAYSTDKKSAEQIFINHSYKLCGELLRIPAVFGQKDKNLADLFRMSRKGRLPEIIGEISCWYCISNLDIAIYIHHWLNHSCSDSLDIKYLLSEKRFSVNDLVKAINQHIHGQDYQSKKKRLLYIKLIYIILSVKNFVLSGFRWNNFPRERFQDLFRRDWKIEYVDKIGVHFVDFNLSDIWIEK